MTMGRFMSFSPGMLNRAMSVERYLRKNMIGCSTRSVRDFRLPGFLHVVRQSVEWSMAPCDVQ